MRPFPAVGALWFLSFFDVVHVLRLVGQQPGLGLTRGPETRQSQRTGGIFRIRHQISLNKLLRLFPLGFVAAGLVPGTSRPSVPKWPELLDDHREDSPHFNGRSPPI